MEKGALERGAKLSRFEVVERLGEGGMGVVFSAHDPTLDRKVAIKILHPAALPPELRAKAKARLVREAQAMAKLKHPNVVAVHEVGEDGDDVFVVMEYVEGKTLAAWLGEKQRSWSELSERFLEAGRGLAAAHGAGLVHRDFKPENVLIGKDERAKVTDFGLVAVRDGEIESASFDDSRKSVSLTTANALLGTPAYMAPEQHEQKAVDARADQFAFAVVLYEALYGERPFDGADYRELRESVLAGKIREPKRKTSVPAEVRAALLRGLEVDPERRYPSMDALLSDLSPAPEPSRFNASTAVMASIFVLAVLAVIIQAKPHTGLCHGAEERLSGVWDEAVKSHVHDAMIATGKPVAADTYRRVEGELDKRAHAWTAMYRDSCEATHVRHAQTAEVLDLRTRCLDRRRRELGALTALFSRGPDAEILPKALDAVYALPPLDTCASTEALTAAVPPPSDAAVRARVDAIRTHIDEASALVRAAKLGDAEERTRSIEKDAAEVDYAPVIAEASALKGRLALEKGDFKASEASLRAAALEAAKAGDDRLVASLWIDLVTVVGLRLARYDEALALEPVADSAIERSGNDPMLRASLLNQVSLVLRDKGSTKEAVKKAEEAVELIEKTGGPETHELGRALNDLGTVLFVAEELDRARQVHERALAIQQKLFGEKHPSVASVLNNLGNIAGQKGDMATALGFFQRAGAIYEEALGPEHPTFAVSLNNQGITLSYLGRHAESRAVHERALAIRKKALGDNHPEVAESLAAVADELQAEGKSAEALAYHAQAVAVLEQPGSSRKLLGPALENYGRALLRAGKLPEAEQRILGSVAVEEDVYGKDSLSVMVPLITLSDVYLRTHRVSDALAVLERAYAISEARAAAADPAEVAAVKLNYAHALWDSNKDRKRAVELGTAARDAFQKAGDGYKEDYASADEWVKKHH